MQIRRPLSLGLAALALGAGAVSLASPADAAKTITITIREGGTPDRSAPAATVGDRVVFKNGATSGQFAVNGDFSTPALRPGASSAAFPLTQVKTYSYTIALGGIVPSGGGSVVVSAATTSPTPAPIITSTPRPTSAPTTPTTAAPVAPGAPTTSAPALPPGALPTTDPGVPAPVSTGGNGVALQPRLDGGLLPFPSASAGIGGPAPQVAPDGSNGFFPSQELAPGSAGGGSLGGTAPTTGQDAQALPTERLNDPETLRKYGLPAVVGLVLLGGAFSLVLRVLFATTDLRDFVRGDLPIHRSA